MTMVPTIGAAENMDASGAHVWAFDSGASPKAIVIALAGGTTTDTTSVDYGGKTLAKWAQGEWSVGGHQRGEVWGYIGSDVPSGSNDVTVVVSNAAVRTVVPMAFAASGPLVLDSPVYTKSTASGAVNFTMNSGTDIGIGIVAGSVKATSGPSGNPVAGTTEDADRWAGGDKQFSIGHETAQGTGSRAVGFTNTWLCGAAGVMLLEQDIDITPDPWGVGLGFNAGAVAVGANLVIPGARMTPLRLGFRAGEVAAEAPRQVALVGEGLETPEMTVSNVEGAVLTQHANRRPTWEEGGGGGSSSRWAPLTVEAPAPGPTPSEIVEVDVTRSTTSAVLEDITGATLDITLPRPAKLAVQMAFSCLTTAGASASTIGFAVNIDGTDHQELLRLLSGANDRGIGAVVHLSDVLPAGTYTVKGRFRRTTGVATPGLDALSLVVEAVPSDPDWQLLFTDGGDVVMMQVADESIWDEHGDLAVLGVGGLGTMGLGEEGLGE